MEESMAENKKKIPCRVCGKLFEPCAYCQSHADVFRWRNFACSRECAAKYIDETIAYRESLKNKGNGMVESVDVSIEKNAIENPTATRRKTKKKISTETIENTVETETEIQTEAETENKETE